jgi:hypothetical protein
MQCTSCSTEISAETIFCPKCGLKQTDEPTSKLLTINLMDRSNNLIDQLIQKFRQVLSVSFFEKNNSLAKTASSWATPGAALLGLLIGIVAAIKNDSFLLCVLGILWVVTVAIAYYIGNRFLSVCENSLKNNETSISSSDYLDCCGLICIAVLCSTIFWGGYTAIKISDFNVLIGTAAFAIALIYYVCLLLNPQLISTRIVANNSAGEDALAIVMIMYKAGVKLATIMFGGLTTIGTLFLLYFFYQIISSTRSNLLFADPSSLGGVALVLLGLLFPLGIYLTFIFVYLIVDLCKAVLSLSKRQ